VALPGGDEADYLSSRAYVLFQFDESPPVKGDVASHVERLPPAIHAQECNTKDLLARPQAYV